MWSCMLSCFIFTELFKYLSSSARQLQGNCNTSNLFPLVGRIFPQISTFSWHTFHGTWGPPYCETSSAFVMVMSRSVKRCQTTYYAAAFQNSPKIGQQLCNAQKYGERVFFFFLKKPCSSSITCSDHRISWMQNAESECVRGARSTLLHCFAARSKHFEIWVFVYTYTLTRIHTHLKCKLMHFSSVCVCLSGWLCLVA